MAGTGLLHFGTPQPPLKARSAGRAIGHTAARTATDDDLNLTQWVAVLVALLVLLVPLAVAQASWCKRRYAQAVVQRNAPAARPAVAPSRPCCACWSWVAATALR